jgi:hypothetical protein
MKGFIKDRLKELLFEEVQIVNFSDVSEDDFDELEDKTNEMLKNNKDISFGSANPFEVLLDDNTNEVVGGTFIEDGPVFSPHIYIKDNYRGGLIFKKLIDNVLKKYFKMKEIRNGDYDILLNVTNKKLAEFLIKNYNFKMINSENNSITLTL